MLPGSKPPNMIASASIVSLAIARSGWTTFGDEIVFEIGGFEAELAPFQAEQAGSDRSRRRRWRPFQSAEQAGFIKSPQRADVKHHRPITAARQAQRHAGLRRLLSLESAVDLVVRGILSSAPSPNY